MSPVMTDVLSERTEDGGPCDCLRDGSKGHCVPSWRQRQEGKKKNRGGGRWKRRASSGGWQWGPPPPCSEVLSDDKLPSRFNDCFAYFPILDSRVHSLFQRRRNTHSTSIGLKQWRRRGKRQQQIYGESSALADDGSHSTGTLRSWRWCLNEQGLIKLMSRIHSLSCLSSADPEEKHRSSRR